MCPLIRASVYATFHCCIDGTHIVIDPPSERKDDYIDRKGNMSITLQAVCNEHKKFIDIFVGFRDRLTWVFQNSNLYRKLETNCKDYYLLGDSAYPCTQHLVTPYRDNGHLTRAEKNFNIKLSSGRVAIEHCFGILKQRFRQLYFCKLKGQKKVCHFIRACCVLHNIAKEDDLEFVMQDEEGVLGYVPEQISRGNAVRNTICQQLPN
ncbi:PREDICTED: putative nuclease HARBI1 [Rhagoletis zephyria]|uniref:putative nuclease HARBI1 n=1 Tax=Rhagoletis zephyria TaxID=28612 RepID=UPI0008118837|nr:PREDICTED: putative nuclease HARBI1 [Rhagoletis zephyria]